MDKETEDKMNKAASEYLRHLPKDSEIYNKHVLENAFKAGWEASDKELDWLRCPICRRLKCMSDHGY